MKVANCGDSTNGQRNVTNHRGDSSADEESANEEEADNMAFYFPADKWGLQIDSDAAEQFSPGEIAAMKSIARVIKKTTKEEEVRLRTSVEEG